MLERKTVLCVFLVFVENKKHKFINKTRNINLLIIIKVLENGLSR